MKLFEFISHFFLLKPVQKMKCIPFFVLNKKIKIELNKK